MADIANLRSVCEAAGQGHLLQFWDTLEEGQQASLAQEINNLDLQVCRTYFTCLVLHLYIIIIYIYFMLDGLDLHMKTIRKCGDCEDCSRENKKNKNSF